MHLVEHNHSVAQSPQPHELVRHAQHPQQRLVHRAHAVLREQRPLAVREPFLGADAVAAHFGGVAGRVAGALDGRLELLIQQRAPVRELQVGRGLAALRGQKLGEALVHRVPGRLGRQRHVHAAVSRRSLKLEVRVERGFGLALAHRGFHQHKGRTAHTF